MSKLVCQVCPVLAILTLMYVLCWLSPQKSPLLAILSPVILSSLAKYETYFICDYQPQPQSLSWLSSQRCPVLSRMIKMPCTGFPETAVLTKDVLSGLCITEKWSSVLSCRFLVPTVLSLYSGVLPAVSIIFFLSVFLHLHILSCPDCLTYDGSLPVVTNFLVLPDLPPLVSFPSYLIFSCLSTLHCFVYTHITSGFKTSGFKTSGFKTSETSGLQNVRLQNVRFAKRQVYKTSGLQNVRLQNVRFQNVNTSKYYKMFVSKEIHWPNLCYVG